MVSFITKYGLSRLPLLYGDEELAGIVDGFVSQAKGSFRYSQLCNYIENKALQEKKFRMDPYTRYADIIMTEQDNRRINIILWQMIWNQRIVMEFRNLDFNSNDGDTIFAVVEDKWKK